MANVYVTGDVHCPIDIDKLSSECWNIGDSLTKDDVLIVLGDFGLLWKNQPDDEEIYYTNWFNSKPWITCFVCGNHENHWRLSQLPLVEKFGSKVGKISDSIFYLKRGEIYNINGQSFFCMVGAESIDKSSRVIGRSWWQEEIPSIVEMNYGIDNLEKNDYFVDYILAHTLPKIMIKRLMASYNISIEDIDDDTDTYLNKLDEIAKNIYNRYNDATASYLQAVCDMTKFKKYFCGHFHDDVTIGNFTVVYYNIIKL